MRLARLPLRARSSCIMPDNAENPVAEKRPRYSGRARNGQAKRATGIPREPPWSKCNRTTKERGEDEDGKWERDVFISRQCALLQAGVSASARTAAAGAAVSGGSATVQASLDQSSRDIAEGGDVGRSTAPQSHRSPSVPSVAPRAQRKFPIFCTAGFLVTNFRYFSTKVK